jgi:hypothetical protein
MPSGSQRKLLGKAVVPAGGAGDRTGRRAKFKRADMVEAIRKSGGFNTLAAKMIEQKTGRGCAPNTVRNYIERYPECRAAFEETQETTGDMVEGQLLKMIKEGDVTAIIFYCKTKLKHRGYEQNVVINGAVDHAHHHEHHIVIQSMRDALNAEIEGHAAAALLKLPSPGANGQSKRSRGNGSNGSATS